MSEHDTDRPTPEIAPGRYGAVSAVSSHPDSRTAAMELADELYDAVGQGPELLMVFVSYHHAAAMSDIVEALRNAVEPGVCLAVTAESVLGGVQELDDGTGMSAIAMRMPGVTCSPWFSTPGDRIPLDRADQIASRIELRDDTRGLIMLADPFTTPIAELLPALTACGGLEGIIPVAGGLASGASQPGHNALVLNDRVFDAGAIGVTISGPVDMGFVVSQGCRPIGPLCEVTDAKKNLLLELDHEPALDRLRSIAERLPAEDREAIDQGLLIGHALDNDKPYLGRGDFLIRNLFGVEPESNGLVAAEAMHLGQRVQFHLRDAETATEDLQLLLDAEQMDAMPFGCLLFTCNGRGRRMFEQPHHDISAVTERLGGVPTAGYFAAGEIGPLGESGSYVHGQTASIALFRRPVKTQQ